jgi:hypothetical protein
MQGVIEGIGIYFSSGDSRAQILHLPWRRRLSIDLTEALTDAMIVSLDGGRVAARLPGLGGVRRGCSTWPGYHLGPV